MGVASGLKNEDGQFQYFKLVLGGELSMLSCKLLIISLSWPTTGMHDN